MVVGFTTTNVPVQSIATKVVSLNIAHGEVLSIQYHVIKFVSVGGFLHQ
jgi:hypothetical protein